MNYWLLKTEPTTYSFNTLVKEGKTVWDGVSAPAALIYLRQMRKSDKVLVYHSGTEKAIVGVAAVGRDPYPDPALGDPRRVVVDLVPVAPLTRPVPLAVIKADRRFADLGLVRISRLSVMPVTPAAWRALLRLSGK